MPLRAILNGESFYAWDLTEADRKRGFLCPVCETDFIIILPTSNIIKHFRHKSRASHDWKPESQAHLAMKRDLKKLADSYGYSCELEVKVSQGGDYRIADVLIKEKIVIECQCSRISIKEYEERTRFYQDNGYQLIWLLGARGTTGLDLRIQQDYFDVFYSDEGSIHSLMGDRISLEVLIYLTSGPVLKEKREEQERIEEELREQNRIERERWEKHREEEYFGVVFDERDIGGAYRNRIMREKADIWRANWGAKGRFTKPIIFPRRMPTYVPLNKRTEKEGVDILDKKVVVEG